MSSYTQPISATHVGGIDFRLNEQLEWRIGSMQGPSICVPKDYPFNVSIPRLLRWLFNPLEPKFLKAAALHDYMLAELKWNRLTAGAEFHEALKADKVSKWERFLMFSGVVFYKYS